MSHVYVQSATSGVNDWRWLGYKNDDLDQKIQNWNKLKKYGTQKTQKTLS